MARLPQLNLPPEPWAGAGPEEQAAPPPVPRRRRWPRVLLFGVLPALLVLLFAPLLALWGTGYIYSSFPSDPAAVEAPPPADSSLPPAKQLARLQAERKKLDASLQRLLPKNHYLVIDQTNNRLYIRQGEKVILEAVCSAGSGMILQEPKGKARRWVFDTPRGVFKVLSKLEDPVWRKPDWAFVEEGEPIPKDPAERMEYGVMGEYALYFGDGYLIHGTLYERLLGRSVTHGCIRLGRENLRKVYEASPVGTPIYIY